MSMKNMTESEEIISILVNYPALLLRKKCPQYPGGRTSYRFKRELRKQVTILGKSAFAGVLADMEKKPQPVTFNEQDYKETVD
jgi:hypothetical protein